MENEWFSELARLVNINSHTPNKAGVDHCGELIREWMESLDFTTRVFPREHIGDHLLFSSHHQPDRPRLLLLGHHDTVFPPGTFETFSDDADWIYGPGVCDMKGGIVVAVDALRAVRQDQGGIVNIDMLLVSDEETGSEDSSSLSSELARGYDACLVFEAAGPDHEVVTGRKGVGTFQIELTGKAAHAGNHYRDGHDANLAAAHMVIALASLTDLEQGTTVNAGKMSGGIGANTISPRAHILVELRYTQMEERERVLGALQAICEAPVVANVDAQLSGRIQREVMVSTPRQEALIATIEGLLGYTLPTEQRGGVSDANTVSAAGLAVLDGWGPFGDGDHTVHERALKSSFTRRVGEVSTILSHFNAWESEAREAG